jgi:hypothetical protein
VLIGIKRRCAVHDMETLPGLHRVTRVLPGVSFCGEGRLSQETKSRGQLSINQILGGGAGVDVIH